MVWNGKKYSPESKQKIRNGTLRGFSKIDGVKYANKVFHWKNKITGREEFCNPYDLYTKYNLDKGNLSHVCSNKCRSHKGWVIVSEPCFAFQ